MKIFRADRVMIILIQSYCTRKHSSPSKKKISENQFLFSKELKKKEKFYNVVEVNNMSAYTFDSNDVVTLLDYNTNKYLLGGFAGDPSTEFLEEVDAPNEPQDEAYTEFQLIRYEPDPTYFYVMTA